MQELRSTMTQDVYTVTPDAPLDEVVREMASHKYGSVIVVDHGHVVGIFTTIRGRVGVSLRSIFAAWDGRPPICGRGDARLPRGSLWCRLCDIYLFRRVRGGQVGRGHYRADVVSRELSPHAPSSASRRVVVGRRQP